MSRLHHGHTTGHGFDVAAAERLRRKGASIALEAANPAYETRIFGPDRVLLTPDCGFATFADNPVASARVAEDKLRAIVEAAELVRRG